MGLQAVTPTGSFDQAATYLLDLREQVDQILLDDTQILNVLGIDYGSPVDQTKHEWDEDELNPNSVKAAAAGALTTASTVLLISASESSRITAGTLLKDALSGKYEVLQVTARTGVSATVTRGYNATSAEAHANSASYDIIYTPRPEGMDGPKDESVARTRSYNFTTILSKGVRLTGTAQAIKHNGISNEEAYQVDKRLRELMRDLDSAIIKSIRSSTRHSDTVYGTMGGLIDYIKHASGGNTNSTAETITPSVINAMAKQIYDDGGQGDILLVGAVQGQKINGFDKEYRRSTMDTRRVGFTVTEFLTDLGVPLRVVIDRWMPVDCAMILDSTRIAIKPMVGRSFFIEALAKTGDFTASQIVGEYTMEVRQAAKAHAIHWNLKQ